MGRKKKKKAHTVLTLWSGGSITAAESLSFLTISTINKCKETGRQAGHHETGDSVSVWLTDWMERETPSFYRRRLVPPAASLLVPLSVGICARVCRHSRLVPLPWSDACSQTQTEKQRTLTRCFSICTDTCSDPGLQRRRVPTFEGLKVKWREKKQLFIHLLLCDFLCMYGNIFFFLRKQTLKWSHRGRSFKNILRGIMQFRLKIMT